MSLKIFAKRSPTLPYCRLLLTAMCLLEPALSPCFAAGGTHTVSRTLGIAWQVQGVWRVRRSASEPVTVLRSGSPILPGTLLEASHPETPHSITLLLPDGQRVLDECFKEADCRRGFRIPSVIHPPTAFQAQLLARIRKVLMRNNEKPSEIAEVHASPARQDEVVSMAVPDVAKPGIAALPYLATATGILSALPDGAYTYDTRRVDVAAPVILRQPWSKKGARCIFPVPAPGLYEITVRDSFNNARVNLMLGAILPGNQSILQTFLRARKQLEDWDGDNYGWPVDALLRAYLKSLIAPQGTA